LEASAVTVLIRTELFVASRLKPVARYVLLALVTQLAACSTLSDFVGGDKVDYRTTGAKKGPGLEVPPDLTQLSRDPRYQAQGGSINASTFPATVPGGSAMAPTTPAVLAATAAGHMTIERSGNQRWLSTALPAEKIWPLLQAFWTERGFTLISDQADVGIMETEWAENRAKLPQDLIRRSIGRVFESLYSTGERDKFRTRVERTATGTDIYISHRGMVEVYTNTQQDRTVWQPRPADLQLEAELLQRLMVKLGATEETAKAATTQTPTSPARARLIEDGTGTSLQLDDGFERAWRRVGLALDRTGFTVEDRDRSQGVYYVRYVDPAQDKKEEPGFFGKLFSSNKATNDASNLNRYRVNVKSQGERSIVAIQSGQGVDATGEIGKRIVGLLIEDLK
jgi:outer membrane protein assembly factor BamC